MMLQLNPLWRIFSCSNELFNSFPEARLPQRSILFTSTLFTSFIREDLRLLQKSYDVDLLVSSGFLAPLRIVPRIFRCDVTYTWFASVYAFFVVLLGRLFGKRSIIVIGGVDVAKMPEIRYGIWLTPWKVPFVKWAIRHAYRVLAVDPSLQRDAARLAQYSGRNIEYVPTGYDANVWKPSGAKEPFVLTVAACDDHWRMKKKGLDILFEAARRCPEVRFIVVGINAHLIEETRRSTPDNVELIAFLHQEMLLKYYQRAAVYCQPSYTEGLPNSLCEAMLCECVAVGTTAGGIPTAIRDHGYLVSYGDVTALAEAIREALAAPAGSGKQGRDFISQAFTLERREEALRRIVEEAARS